MATKFCAVAPNICGFSVGNEDNIKMDLKEFGLGGHGLDLCGSG
jgi:hypothetical protein